MGQLATMALMVAFSMLAACGGGDDSDAPDPTESPEATATPETASSPSTEDLARSVVQIIALDSDRTPVWTGSGTVVSSDGLILTNAHVVDDRFDEYARLGVAVIERTD